MEDGPNDVQLSREAFDTQAVLSFVESLRMQGRAPRTKKEKEAFNSAKENKPPFFLSYEAVCDNFPYIRSENHMLFLHFQCAHILSFVLTIISYAERLSRCEECSSRLCSRDVPRHGKVES